MPPLTLFALKGMLDLEALNSNNVRGGTCLADAGSATKSGRVGGSAHLDHRHLTSRLHECFGGLRVTGEKNDLATGGKLGDHPCCGQTALVIEVHQNIIHQYRQSSPFPGVSSPVPAFTVRGPSVSTCGALRRRFVCSVTFRASSF